MDLLYTLFTVCFCVAVLEFVLLLVFKCRLDTKELMYQTEAASHEVTKATLQKMKAERDAAKLDLLWLMQKNSELENLTKTKSRSVRSASRDDILDAIRYAVIKSHPDNGGNTDDFVKFNQCYRELKNEQRETRNNDDFVFYKKKT